MSKSKTLSYNVIADQLAEFIPSKHPVPRPVWYELIRLTNKHIKLERKIVDLYEGRTYFGQILLQQLDQANPDYKFREQVIDTLAKFSLNAHLNAYGRIVGMILSILFCLIPPLRSRALNDERLYIENP